LQITDLTIFFSDRSKDFAVATNFRLKMGEIGRLTFIRRLAIPKAEWIIAITMSNVSSAMIWQHCVKIW